jgi:hypothetical protein
VGATAPALGYSETREGAPSGRTRRIAALICCGALRPLVADIVAKVAEAPLWNSNLKQSHRGVRTFESMLRVRVRT